MAIDLAGSADQQAPEPASLGCLKDEDHFARNRPTNVQQISLRRSALTGPSLSDALATAFAMVFGCLTEPRRSMRRLAQLRG